MSVGPILAHVFTVIFIGRSSYKYVFSAMKLFWLLVPILDLLLRPLMLEFGVYVDTKPIKSGTE